ncbi:hypothetical protein GOPIP_081_00360 [Gordonia polyisoprenivorans NBRC 16320 = JCM 10675]|nr:hypothetical protein GOPIP_081_00360 [Gordonia polyisoprenivorans NBRC 16320 = JCM 10675]
MTDTRDQSKKGALPIACYARSIASNPATAQQELSTQLELLHAEIAARHDSPHFIDLVDVGQSATGAIPPGVADLLRLAHAGEIQHCYIADGDATPTNPALLTLLAPLLEHYGVTTHHLPAQLLPQTTTGARGDH